MVSFTDTLNYIAYKNPISQTAIVGIGQLARASVRIHNTHTMNQRKYLKIHKIQFYLFILFCCRRAYKAKHHTRILLEPKRCLRVVRP